MAQFHCIIKVYSRADGHSCVAAAAYQSRSSIVNMRDGIRHDYRRCHEHEELVADLGVALPTNAPERWLDRRVLWNEVESVERSARAQLARRIEVALPRELPRNAQLELAHEIVRAFVDEGMCVDACVHDALDGHNPHLHMLMPLRSCDENGFLPKSVNVYTVRDEDGTEVQATAAELKELNSDEVRYEKIYKYRHSGETLELTPTQAEGMGGCRRVSKTPLQSTRYLNTWNDKDNAVKWRERIADMSNAALERHGFAERVSHLSYAARNIDCVPTIHEGHYVRKAESEAESRAGAANVEYEPVTERRRHNEHVQRANIYLRKLLELARKLLEMLKKLNEEREKRTGKNHEIARRHQRTRQHAASMNFGR